MSLFSGARDPATSSNDGPPMVPGDSSFPMDVIGEILMRLPVKSILRFKCICKAWNALIIESQFVKKHFRTANPSRHHVLAVSVEPTNTVSLVDYSLHSGLVDYSLEYLLYSSSSPFTCSKVDLPFEGDLYPYFTAPLVGRCHGMLCFVSTGYNNLILFNPATRKLKKLPFLEFPRDACKCFGFGYDDISDSYKVVAVFSHCREDGGDAIDAAVHTLGTDSWRRFNEKFPTFLLKDPYGIFVRGTSISLGNSHTRKFAFAYEESLVSPF